MINGSSALRFPAEPQPILVKERTRAKGSGVISPYGDASVANDTSLIVSIRNSDIPLSLQNDLPEMKSLLYANIISSRYGQYLPSVTADSSSACHG